MVPRVINPAMLKQVFRSSGFCYNSASNLLASVGDSHNGRGDRWNIAVVTARYANRNQVVVKSAKICRDMPTLGSTDFGTLTYFKQIRIAEKF
jgi:hypothetical protein